MSGHSKWSSIKHKKGAADAKRGKLFTKLARAITVAARDGGAAVLVEALTDNRNRTSAEVRHAFSKHNGSLGEPGSVAWIFEKRGVLAVDGARYGEDDLIA